ncbi:MAG: hypothetical protein AB7I37_25290 [Pirellulales bacterium]
MAITALAALSDNDAGWGTITYNSFTFPGLRDVKLTGKPEYDQAGRAVIYTVYTLRVHCFVTGGSEATHRADMVTLRQKLQDPGQTLVYSGQGVGDIQVNGGGATHTDVQWGPKPQVVEFIQIGTLTTEVIWECSFAIKEGATSLASNLAAFCYAIDWDYDEAGSCTRVINGYVQIAQTRSGGGRTITTSAESYRHSLRVSIPNGFRRGPRRFSLSHDRNRLDFSITDIQLEAEAPPTGALRAELDYEIESNPPGFAQYTATLAGTIETPPGVPTIRAGEIFVRVMLDKFRKLKAAARSGAVIPLRLRFGRTLGTRQSRFGIAWLVTGCLDNLLRDGGIWQPLDGESYTVWWSAMQAAGVFSNSGSSSLFFIPSEDAVVDLAGSQSNGSALPFMGGGGGFNPDSATASAEFGLGDLQKENSWLSFENRLKVMREHAVILHHAAEQFLPGTLAAGNIATDTGVSMAVSVSGEGSAHVAQYQGTPRDLILMQGKGMRINPKGKDWLPAVPRLVSVRGIPVEEVKVVTDGPKAIACFFGATVYSLRWAVLYRLRSGYLNQIPSMENPALCCDTKSAS